MSTPTQNGHTTTAQLFADHVLKDGSRAGSKQVGDFTKAFVDAVDAKLLVVESLDAEGNVVRRERRRMAIAAMGACRRAWFVMQRSEKAIVPADNPFAKMGLKKLAPGQKKTETPTATWDELMAFRMSAVKLGYASIATAALTAWPSSRQSSTPLDDVTQGLDYLRSYREAHHPRGRASRRIVIHITSAWRLYGRCGLRSFRCRAACSPPPPLCPAAPHVRQAHP